MLLVVRAPEPTQDRQAEGQRGRVRIDVPKLAGLEELDVKGKFVVAFVQLLLILLAAAWIFDVPVRGSLALLLGVSTLFLLAALAQGLLISVVTKNQQVATQAAAVRPTFTG